MIIILHGNNQLASRKALIDYKDQARKKGLEIFDLIAKTITLTEIKQALESNSLFGQDKLVTIENLFSLPNSRNKENLIGYIKKNDFQTNLIIWENKQIDGRILKSLSKKAKIELYKLPVLIFKFLESIWPENVKSSLNLLHQLLIKQPPELIFYMLARQIRYLIIAKDLGRNGLKEFSPWQQIAYLKQANKFKLEKLLKMHQGLLKADFQQKTGQNDLSLKSTLDLLMIDL